MPKPKSGGREANTSRSTSATHPDEGQASATGTYNLTIFFAGAILLVPQHDPASGRDKLWVLVPDLRSPKLLPDLHGHRSSYSFQSAPSHRPFMFLLGGDLTKLEAPRSRNMAAIAAQLACDGVFFDYQRLDDLDWRLRADSVEETLKLDLDGITPPCPRTDDEDTSLEWALPLDEVVKGLVPPDVPTPQLARELFEQPYYPKSTPWICSRFLFDQGAVQTAQLHLDGEGHYLVTEFPIYAGGKPACRQVLASLVKLTLKVHHGPGSIVGTLLDGSDGPQASVQIPDEGAGDVLAIVANVPVGSGRAASRGHFGIFYSLYDDVSEFRRFPEPMPSYVENDHQGKHRGQSSRLSELLLHFLTTGSGSGQCSPPKSSFPGT